MSERSEGTTDRWQALATGGGALGALLAATCCLGPLLLVTLGVTGAWIGSLTALKSWQPLFLTLAAASLAAGFWFAYRKPAAACASDRRCVPGTMRFMRGVLWGALVLVMLAATVDLWAPFLY